MTGNVFTAARACLDACEPQAKVDATRDTAADWRAGRLDRGDAPAAEAIPAPGRPERPRLVRPRDLPRRDPRSPEGIAALVHAICHIEFNAINLAWDAVYRFRDMPADFYGDWIRVADEEAYHFTLLRDHLQGLGYDYGDFDAHNGLWEMAVETDFDPLVRMALVPRVLEARGLDVTPGIMDKFRAVGDDGAVAILEIILRDEVGHVEIGSRWFRHLCAERGLDPEPTFRDLLGRYLRGRVKGPFHREARLAGGFTEDELAYLESIG